MKWAIIICNNSHQYRDIRKINTRADRQTNRQTEVISTLQLCWEDLQSQYFGFVQIIKHEKKMCNQHIRKFKMCEENTPSKNAFSWNPFIVEHKF